jgi:hypothetical protein
LDGAVKTVADAIIARGGDTKGIAGASSFKTSSSTAHNSSSSSKDNPAWGSTARSKVSSVGKRAVGTSGAGVKRIAGATAGKGSVL